MSETTPAAPRVTITNNGPYRVSGNLPLAEETIGANSAGESVKWVHGSEHAHEAQYSLCRCGHSSNKPFCDGTHRKIGFDGTETANRAPYLEQAKVMKGPAMSLTDVESLCASGRFCDRNGSVWNLVNETDNAAALAHFARQSCDCPSGRLVAWDNATGKPLEPIFPPSIGLVADPVNACLGPIWLRGGVQVVGVDGFEYEVRNRVTLCRCGASNNKPFCDGAHVSIGFNVES